MAMIFCSHCQNEYDNHHAACPYCNHPTPSTKKLQGKLPSLTIMAVIIVAFASMHFFENAPEISWPLDFSSENPPSSAISASYTSEHVLSEYVQSINQQLQDISSSKAARLSTEPTIAENDHIFTHQFNRDALLTVRLNPAHNQIISVELRNTNTRTNRQIMPQLAAILLHSLPSLHIPLEDAQAQVNYLHQFAQTARNCTASYEFEGIYLSENYNRAENSSVISFTHERPKDAC